LQVTYVFVRLVLLAMYHETVHGKVKIRKLLRERLRDYNLDMEATIFPAFVPDFFLHVPNLPFDENILLLESTSISKSELSNLLAWMAVICLSLP
jgi:hypothetical protein